MTKLGVVRHGITQWNIEGRAQGSSDIPLHEKGLREAELLAERLKGEDWDLLYSSPLLRAKQTAECISRKLGGLEVVIDERIRETGGGKIEGTTESERLVKWGHGWRELDLGREQSAQVTKRGAEFVQEIVKVHPGKNILIVSHGSFIRHLLKELMPADEEREPIKNTSVTHLLPVDANWSCGLYNCTAHLEIE